MVNKSNTEAAEQQRLSEGDRESSPLSERLVAYLQGIPSAAFLSSQVSAFKDSAEYRDIEDGNRYYANRGDIDKKQRLIMKSGGDNIVSNVLSNTRLHHPFYAKLVDQKSDYLTEKPWTVQLPDGNEALAKLLDQDYFTPRFRKMISNAVAEAVKCGKAWIQAYVGNDGRIHFTLVPSEYVKPYWRDRSHTSLVAVLKTYKTRLVDASGAISYVDNVEFYNATGVYYYNIDEHNNVTPVVRGENGNFSPYFSVSSPVTDANGVQQFDANGNALTKPINGSFGGKVPFICIKYHDDERPLICNIKDLIDDYDLVTSTVSDFIKDVPSAIKVIKGYEGADREQFVRNLANLRAIFVAKDGGVENLQSAMDVSSLEAHLTRLKNDIYASASGVDLSRTDSVGNASGVALKFIFSDLDNDCQGIWASVRVALNEIYQYICADIVNQGGKNYSDIDIDFVANTDSIIDDSSTIANLVQSQGMLSQRTILENHPYVTDVDAEIKRIDDEKKAQAQESRPSLGFNFDDDGNPITPNDAQGANGTSGDDNHGA